jgi:hypothetical protein
MASRVIILNIKLGSLGIKRIDLESRSSIKFIKKWKSTIKIKAWKIRIE